MVVVDWDSALDAELGSQGQQDWDAALDSDAGGVRATWMRQRAKDYAKTSIEAHIKPLANDSLEEPWTVNHDFDTKDIASEFAKNYPGEVFDESAFKRFAKAYRIAEWASKWAPSMGMSRSIAEAVPKEDRDLVLSAIQERASESGRLSKMGAAGRIAGGLLTGIERFTDSIAGTLGQGPIEDIEAYRRKVYQAHSSADPLVFKSDPWYVSGPIHAAEQVGPMAGAVYAGKQLGAVGKVLGAGAKLVNGLTAAGTGAMVYPQVTDDAYYEMRNEGISEDKARWASRVSGALQAATEVLEVNPLYGAFTQQLKGQIRKSAMSVAKELGKSYLKEAGEEYAQAFEDALVKDVARWADSKTPKGFVESTKEAVAQGNQSLVPLLFMMAPGAGVSTAANYTLPKEKIADIAARVEQGGSPSRKEAEELGIPQEQAKSAPSRRAWFEENKSRLQEQSNVQQEVPEQAAEVPEERQYGDQGESSGGEAAEETVEEPQDPDFDSAIGSALDAEFGEPAKTPKVSDADIQAAHEAARKRAAGERRKGYNLDDEDLTDAVNDAWAKYDPSQGPFENYAATAVSNRILAGRGKNGTKSFAEGQAEQVEARPEGQSQAEEVAGMEAALGSLPKADQELLAGIYGLRGQEKQQAQDIAKRLGITKQAVSKRKAKAEQRLREAMEPAKTLSQRAAERKARTGKARVEAGEEFKQAFRAPLGIVANPKRDAATLDRQIKAAARFAKAVIDDGVSTFAEYVAHAAEQIGVDGVTSAADILERTWGKLRQRAGFEHLDEAGKVADVLKASEEPPAQPESPKPEKPPAKEPSRPSGITSIKNRIVEDLREGRGLASIGSVGLGTFQTWLDEAAAKMESEPTWMEELIAKLTAKSEAVDHVQHAGMQLYYRQVYNRYGEKVDALKAARVTGNVKAIASAQADVEILENRLNEIEEVARRTGTIWGQSGVARKIELLEDFTLAGLRRKATAAKGGEALSEKESTDLEQRAEVFKDLEKQSAEADVNARVDEAIKAAEEMPPEKLDGKTPREWVHAALVDRAESLGIYAGRKTGDHLIRLINEVEAALRDFAESRGIEYRKFLEGIKESIHGVSEDVAREREVKRRAHAKTGISQADVIKLRNSGYDYTAGKKVGGKLGEKLRFFDQYAAEMATEFPDAFLFEEPAEKLWDMLGQDMPTVIRADSPRVMEAAAGWVENAGDLPTEKPSEVQPSLIGESPSAPKSNGRKRKSERIELARGKAKEAVAAYLKTFSGGLGEEGAVGAVNPDRFRAAVEVVKAYAELGTVTFTEFWAEVRESLGKSADTQRDMFKDAWKAAREEGETQAPNIAADDKRAQGQLAKQLVRDLVKSGIKDRETVVDAVWDELQAINPEITREEARDATSDYGDYRDLSKDEIDVDVRKIRGQNQQVAKLRDTKNAIEQARKWLAEGVDPKEVANRLIKQGLLAKRTGTERRTTDNIERELIQQYNELKKQIPVPVEANGRGLKSALESAKTSIRNRLRDMLKEIDQREKIVKERHSVEPDAELEALKKKYAEEKHRWDQVFPRQKKVMTEQQQVDSALRRIAEMEEQIRTKNFPEQENRGKLPKGIQKQLDRVKKRLVAARKVQRESDAGQWEGEGGSVSEDQDIANYTRLLKRRLAEYQRRTRELDFSPKPKKERELTKEQLDIRFKLDQEKEKFREMLDGWKRQRMSPVEKVIDFAQQTANLSFSLLTFSDFMLGRQGAPSLFSNPALTLKTAIPMFKAFMPFTGKKALFDYTEKIQNDPDFQLAMQSELPFTSVSGPRTKQEEVFIGRWAQKIWGIRNADRAAVAFLNELRFRSFKAGLALAADENGKVSSDAAKAIASSVSDWTGRAHLGAFEPAAGGFAHLFFAARYLTSAYKILGEPFRMPFRPAGARKAIAVRYAKTLTGLALVYGLVRFAAWAFWKDDDPDKPSIELDTRSSDALKLKIGPTRFPLLGNVGPTLVFLTRVIWGQHKSSESKVVRDLRGPNVLRGQKVTMSSVFQDYARSKAAPIPGKALDWVLGGTMERDDATGEPIPPTILGTIQGLTIPISGGDVWGIMKEWGVPKGSMLTAVAMLGFGGQTYKGDRSKIVGKLAEDIAGRVRLAKMDDQDKVAMDRAVDAIKELGVSPDEAVSILAKRLASKGYKKDTVNDWAKRLRARLK